MNHLGPHPTQPSSCIMVSLHSLVVSVRHLGIPPGINLPVVSDLVKAFVDDARGLDGWTVQNDEAAAQAAFDIAFLGMFAGEELGGNVQVQKLLTKVRPSKPSLSILTVLSFRLASLPTSQETFLPSLRTLYVERNYSFIPLSLTLIHRCSHLQ